MSRQYAAVCMYVLITLAAYSMMTQQLEPTPAAQTQEPPSQVIYPAITLSPDPLPVPTQPTPPPNWLYSMPHDPAPTPAVTQPSRKKQQTIRVKVTHYCPCRKCCGKWAGGKTAGGVTPQAGRTIAHGWLPFGTVVEINGQRYVVEDRGVTGDHVDVFVESHSKALQLGVYWAEMTIIEMKG